MRLTHRNYSSNLVCKFLLLWFQYPPLRSTEMEGRKGLRRKVGRESLIFLRNPNCMTNAVSSRVCSASTGLILSLIHLGTAQIKNFQQQQFHKNEVERPTQNQDRPLFHYCGQNCQTSRMQLAKSLCFSNSPSAQHTFLYYCFYFLSVFLSVKLR